MPERARIPDFWRGSSWHTHREHGLTRNLLALRMIGLDEQYAYTHRAGITRFGPRVAPGAACARVFDLHSHDTIRHNALRRHDAATKLFFRPHQRRLTAFALDLIAREHRSCSRSRRYLDRQCEAVAGQL